MDKDKKKKQEAMKRRVELQKKGESFMKSFLPNLSNALEATDKTLGMGADYLQYKFANDPRRKAAEARSFQERKQKANQAFEKFGLAEGKFDPGKYAESSTKGGAELTSLVAPGGKTIKQAIVTGGLGGGLYGFSQSDAPVFSQETAKKTAIGAGTGALASGLFKGVTTLAGKTFDKLRGVGQATKKAIVNPKVSADPFAYENEEQIVKTLDDLGLKGSAENIRKNMPTAFRQLTEKIHTRLAKSKEKIPTSDVIKIIDDALDNNVNWDADIPAMTKAKDKYVNQILTKVNKEAGENALSVTPKAIFEVKQNLGKQLSKAFDRMEKGNPLTDKEEVAYTIWKSLDDAITKIDPQLKTLTKTQSKLYEASPGLMSSANKGMSLFGVSLPRMAIEGVQKVASGAGDIMQKVGDVGTRIGTNPAVQASTDAMNKMFSLGTAATASKYGTYKPEDQIDNQQLDNNVHDQTIPDTSSESQVNMDELVTLVGSDGSEIQVKRGELAQYGMNPDGTPLKQEDTTQYITGHSPEEHYAAYTQAVMAGDEDSAKQIRQFYTDELAYQENLAKKNAPVKKSVAQLGREELGFGVDQAVQMLEENDKAVKEGTGQPLKMGIVEGPLEQLKAKFNMGDQNSVTFNTLISELQATIAKARGGTSFTPNEQRLLDKYSPKVGDSEQEIRTKLKGLKEKVDFFKDVEAGGDIQFQSGQSTF